MKTAILLGSSRSAGNTSQLARYVSEELPAAYFDLADYEIAPFSYANQYQDDFKGLITQLLQYEQLILASPVYWYSVSAQMKLFLDRITDLLNYYPVQGRLLRGKSIGVLATGLKDAPPDCFEQMFKLTFEYLGMKYKGMGYCSAPDSLNLREHKVTIETFINKVRKCNANAL